jgi:VanZ family protein
LAEPQLERWRGPARVLAVLATGLALVMALVPHPPPLPGNPGDKLVHAATFVVLALLISLGWPRTGFWRILLSLSAFGGLIELAQGTRIVGRDASAWDWLADVAAASAILALVVLARRLRAGGSR